MLIYLFLLLICWAEPLDPNILLQKIIPEQQAEIQSLEAQKTAQEAFFRGEKEYRDAFLEWRNSPLLDHDFIAGQLLILQNQALERENLRFSQNTENSSKEAQEYYLLLEKKWRLEEDVQKNKERFLLRLLRNDEITHSEQSISKKITAWQEKRQQIDKKKDPEQFVICTQQEQRLYDLKDVFIEELTWMETRAADNFLLEEKELAKKAEELFEIDGSMERISLLVAFDQELDAEQTLAELEQKREKFEQIDLEKKLEEVKKNWDITKLSEEEMKSLQGSLEQINSSLNPENKLDQIRIQINQYKLSTINSYFSVQKELETQKIEEELLASQEKLEEAKIKQATEKEKKLQQEIILIREKETTIRKNEAKRRTEILNFIAQQQKSVEDVRVQIKKVKDLPPMASERQAEIDLAYKLKHNVRREVQTAIMTLRAERISFEEAQGIDEAQINSQLSGNTEYQEAKTDLHKAYLARQNNIEEEEIGLVEILFFLQEQSIDERISDVMDKQLQLHFWEEFHAEIANMWSVLRYQEKKQFSSPWKLRSISGYIKILFYFLLTGILWRFVRKYSQDIWRFIWRWASNQKIEILEGRQIPLSRIAERTIEREDRLYQIFPHIIDIIFLYVLSIFITYENIWLQTTIQMILLFVAWTICSPLVLLWFSEGKEDIQAKLRSGMRQLVVYIIGIRLLVYLLTTLFLAERLVNVIQFLQIFLIGFWTLYQLGVWEVLILRKVNTIQGMEKWKHWLSLYSDNLVGRRIKSLIGLSIILMWIANQFLFFVAEHSKLVGALLARNSLQHSDLELESPDQKIIQQFQEHQLKNILFERELERLQHSFDGWKKEQRRGLVAVIGERGVGKTALINCFLQQNSDYSAQKIEKENNGETVLEKFSDRYQEDFSTTVQIVEYLKKIEKSHIICIDDFHRYMFRDIGGYDQIKELLAIIQGTAHKHFWVVSCHHHSWVFLHSSAVQVNLNIFRDEIIFKERNFLELQDWFSHRCEKIGKNLDFSYLSNVNTEEGRLRSEKAFWRILSDVSKGNPTIAEHFFMEALRKGEEDTLYIVLFPFPKEAVITALRDVDFFVLASILLHNGLMMEELQKTLQVGFVDVQSSCRNLLGLGLIEKIDDVYFIEPKWLSVIERILVTKRMIYVDM